MNLKSMTQVNYNDPFPLVLKKVVPVIATPVQVPIEQLTTDPVIVSKRCMTMGDLQELGLVDLEALRQQQKIFRHVENYGTNHSQLQEMAKRAMPNGENKLLAELDRQTSHCQQHG